MKGAFADWHYHLLKTYERTDVMENKKGKLTSREKLFCSCYVNSGDISQSAQKAGYKGEFRQEGEKLLCRSDILDEIARLSDLQKRSLSQMAMVGYQRLAFGNIADAVELLYLDKPTQEQLNSMDLFSVAEIKRPKDGAMEIKFFDRLKALEKLELGMPDSNIELPFYEAIRAGAKAVCSSEEVRKDEV